MEKNIAQDVIKDYAKVNNVLVSTKDIERHLREK